MSRRIEVDGLGQVDLTLAGENALRVLLEGERSGRPSFAAHFPWNTLDRLERDGLVTYKQGAVELSPAGFHLVYAAGLDRAAATAGAGS